MEVCNDQPMLETTPSQQSMTVPGVPVGGPVGAPVMGVPMGVPTAHAPMYAAAPGGVPVAPMAACVAGSPVPPLELALMGYPRVRVEFLLGSGMCGSDIEFSVRGGGARIGTAAIEQKMCNCGGEIDISLRSGGFRLMEVKAQ